MTKRFLTYIGVFIFVGIIFYFAEELFLQEIETVLKKSIFEGLTFNFIFSLSVVVIFDLMGKSDKFFPQLGFLYMGVIVLKIMAIAVLFQEEIFGETSFSFSYMALLLASILVFLGLEVFFIIKILGKSRV